MEKDIFNDAETPSPPPVLVLGVGNILLGDEGAGIRVVEEVSKHQLPEGVEVVDGGTLQMALTDIIRHRQKVIVVDAVSGGDKPGSLYRFNVDDLQEATSQIGSVHDIGVIEAVFFLNLTEEMPPEFIFYGIEPQSLEPSLELTSVVANALPRLTQMVMKEAGISENSAGKKCKSQTTSGGS